MVNGDNLDQFKYIQEKDKNNDCGNLLVQEQEMVVRYCVDKDLR
jgi:hypothetical protein